MWSRRAQEYEAKISSGKIYELAEVVRDLNKGDDLMVDQSYSEMQLFEKAYERILVEFQIILDVSLEDTQKKLDKALKRNLGVSQQQQTAPAAKITTTTNLPTEEPLGETEEAEDPYPGRNGDEPHVLRPGEQRRPALCARGVQPGRTRREAGPTGRGVRAHLRVRRVRRCQLPAAPARRATRWSRGLVGAVATTDAA